MRPVVNCDAELDLAGLNESFVQVVERGEPFGLGNPTPQFLVRAVRPVGEIRVLKGQHLKFRVRGNGSGEVDCIGFGMADREPLVRSCGEPGLDLAARVGINEWQGRRTVQLQLRAVRPSGSSGHA